jgi:formyl-CoA transferase
LQDISIALDLDEDLSERPEFATLELQMRSRRALQQIFRERFATNTTEYWMGRLEGRDLLCAPVRQLADALADEQTAVNGMVIDIGTDAHGKTMRAVGSPVHLSDTPARLRHRPPRLGEHTDQVLAEVTGDGDRVGRPQASKAAAVTR